MARPEPYLPQAQDDATLLAIRAQEEAGLDIITDGEIRRESYSNRFATALEGVDIDNPGTALDRSGHPNPVPRIVGTIRRRHAVEVEDLQFLKRHTTRTVKITVPGPFTMTQQAQNDFYAERRGAAMDYAAAVNEEIKDLFAAGADIVQIDEPYMQARPEKARAVRAEGAEPRARRRQRDDRGAHLLRLRRDHPRAARAATRSCPSCAGCTCKQVSIETAQSEARLRGAGEARRQEDHARLHRPVRHERRDAAGRGRRASAARCRTSKPEKIIVAPDCGMKYLPREVARRQDEGDGGGGADCCGASSHSAPVGRVLRPAQHRAARHATRSRLQAAGVTTISASSPAAPASPTAPIDIVINAGAGPDDSTSVRALIEGVLQAAGRAHRVHFVDGSVSVASAAQAALEQAQRDGGIVVAVGGDGTINSVAQAVHAAGMPLGVIPQGTFNYFGRAHGLPLEPQAAMRAILDGRVEPVQVGLANGRVFLVNASVGLYPELLQDREAWKARFGRSRAVAFMAALTTLFAAHRQMRLAISHEDGDVDIRTLTLVAGNNPLQLERLGLPEAAQLERGQLAVITVEPVSTWHLLGLVLRGALGTLGNADAVRRFSTRRVDIRPRGMLPGRRRIKIALDGEIAWTQMPLRIEVAERPLWLVKPTTTVDAHDGAPAAARADGDAASAGSWVPGLVPAT